MKKRKYSLVVPLLLFSSTLIAEGQNSQGNLSSNNIEMKTPSMVNEELPPKKPLVESSPKTDAKQPSTESSSKVETKSKEKLNAFLGEMKPTLEKATKIEAYLLHPTKEGDSTPEESQLGGYPVRGGPKVLTVEQQKQLKTLVLSESSYFWGPPHKKCLVAPVVALRFIKGNTEVSILLSMYCDMWTFIHQSKTDTQDYTPIAGQVDQLVSKLFPTEFPEKPTQ